MRLDPENPKHRLSRPVIKFLGVRWKRHGNKNSIDDVFTSGDGYINGYGPFVCFACESYCIQLRLALNTSNLEARNYYSDAQTWTAWKTL